MDEFVKHGSRYSRIEDSTIRNMLNDGNSTLDIAKFLDRPIGGVEKRISRLKQNKKTSHASGNVRFDEMDKIIDMYLSGKTIGEIVNETKRSDRSIGRIIHIVKYTLNKINKSKKCRCNTCVNNSTSSNKYCEKCGSSMEIDSYCD